MFIRFFKTNQPASLFAIPLVAMLCWLPAFLDPRPPEAGSMPLYKLVLRLLDMAPAWLMPLTGVAIVSAQAIFLNNILNTFEVLYKRSYLPSLFFTVLASSLPVLLTLHPSLLAAGILLLALQRIFSMYKNDSSLHLSFEAGLLIAIASLFYFPAISFILLFYFSLATLRPFVWREWIAPVIGLVIPYIFASTWYFWHDRLPQFYDAFAPELLAIGTGSGTPEFDPGVMPFLFWVGLISLLAFNKLARNFFKNVIRTRSFQQVLLLWMMVSILPVFVFPHVSPGFAILLIIPLAVFTGYYFLAVKRVWLVETLFGIGLVMLIYMHLA